MEHKYDKNFHFNNAKMLLEKDDLQSIRYACLELRYFIEAHVYERLYQETDILPQTVIATWQPNKAIKFLAMFDELADKDLVMSVYGEDGKEVAKIEYNNLSIKELNKFYNSLGSYLHLPMPKKVGTYIIKKTKVLDIVAKLERVTKGNLMIIKKDYDKFSCEACSSDIVFTRKYVEQNESIKCQNDRCGIEHGIRVNENSVEFGAKYVFDCGVCKEKVSIFHSNIEDLYSFQCDNCETQYQFKLTLRGIPKNET
ncbi:hypothetical protein [Vibrio metschnikovii]|uniref:hypothetical protein n=1 Tax=Vibrio metschnikovii TaxID=28172 RepID=UPI001C2F50CF|nr:hypothetical protein [Vibrio metschnikovii]